MGSVNLGSSKSNAAATKPSTTNPKLQQQQQQQQQQLQQRKKKLESQPPQTPTTTTTNTTTSTTTTTNTTQAQLRGDPFTRPPSRLSNKRLSSFETPTVVANRSTGGPVPRTRPTIITKSVAKAHQHTAHNSAAPAPAPTSVPTSAPTSAPTTTSSFARTSRKQTITSSTATDSSSTCSSSTSTSTSTSSRPIPAKLQLRDQNASSGSSPLLKPSGTGTGPGLGLGIGIGTISSGGGSGSGIVHNMSSSYDTNGSRPQMPSLSAAAARTMNRGAPLTPKIASRGPQSPGLASSTNTPMNRRPPRPTTANSNRDSYHDDLTPALTPHLASNVTPRSGARQNRVDSASSTPNGTPNPDRHSEGWDPKSSFRLSSPPFDGDAARRPVVTFSLVNGQGRQDTQDTPESKFFHANDAKPPRPASTRPLSTGAVKPSQQPKGPTFFYANGTTIDNKSPASPTTFTPAAPGHAQENPSGSKFMYANGVPEAQPRPAPLASRRSGSTSSVTSRAHTSRPSLSQAPSGSSSGQRPSSPVNAPSQSHPAPPRSINLPQGAVARPHVASPQLAPSPPGLRRTNHGASRPTGHSRSGSLVKEGSSVGTARPPLASPKADAAFPLTPGASKPAPLTLASIIQAAEEFTEKEESASPSAADDDQSGLQSPKSTHSTEPVNDLVANARRERKVQDLQITNASLEAINRTLERQLRKQTAELRRYKRLSRSGRLAVAPSTAPAPESSDDPHGEHHALGLKLSDLSEEESDEDKEPGEEEEEEEEESLSDSATSSLSPSDIAENDAKHRPRDEQRLQLDLAKHQEFLVDSQKINQSIRRCLDWTEELIKDGKKALEYRVKASDVVLGGRVLDPLDDDEDERGYSVDGSRDDTMTLDDKSVNDGDSASNWGAGPQDRDSGIELRVDG
ncbi:hypothetical protein F5X96DRAFT_345444 [Biscogniauxia mediterranea]|nr:hypothetical protein F5X96DRAFT_345444 [Biscogniauxia mediterranea]